LQAGRGTALTSLDTGTSVGFVYYVGFNADVTGCAITVTVGTGSKGLAYTSIPVGTASFAFEGDTGYPASEPGIGSAITVVTRDATGASAPLPFELTALC
jgi:hypothetical protein